ncbi:MAG: trigger factor [Victivallales bacterium]|jgi:trigger factor
MTASKESLKDLIKTEVSGSEPCVKSVKFTVPAKAVDTETDAMLKEFAKFAQVPGFRAGKTPLSLIRNRFLPRIEGETVKNFFTAAFEKIASDESFDVVSYSFPDAQPEKLEAGKDYSFTIVYNVSPEIKLGAYKGIKISVPEVKVEESRVDEELKNLREMYGEFTKTEGPAAKGDMVKISYKSDFAVPEGADSRLKILLETPETWAWLSDPEIIPGINKVLEGAVAGKDYELTAQFPEDFREKPVAGKKVKYSVKTIEIQRRAPVSSDEDLVKKVNAKDMNELRERLKGSLAFQEKQKAEAEAKKDILEKVIAEAGEFPIPPSVLAEAENKEFRLIATREVKKESDVEKFKTEKDKHLAEAKKSAAERMRRYFVLRKIARTEKITIEKNEMDSHISGISKYYGVKEQEFRNQLDSSGGMEDLQMDMLMAKVTDFLIKNADTSKPA